MVRETELRSCFEFLLIRIEEIDEHQRKCRFDHFQLHQCLNVRQANFFLLKKIKKKILLQIAKHVVSHLSQKWRPFQGDFLNHSSDSQQLFYQFQLHSSHFCLDFFHIFPIFLTFIPPAFPTSLSASLKAEQNEATLIILIIILHTMNNKCKKISKNTKHYFVLSGQEDLYFRQEIAVLFKPYNKTKNRTRTSITPTFNNDRKYYTYSFALPSSPVENQDQLEIDHRKRVAESLIEIEDILVPKPRSKHKYCGVCRGHYEDYKQHTQGPEHNLFLKKSQYQGLIADMCKHAQRNYFKRESREIQESKIIDLTCEENPVKVAGDSCDVSTPIKMSSCRSE